MKEEKGKRKQIETLSGAFWSEFVNVPRPDGKGR
jgi:hypothetical protein